MWHRLQKVALHGIESPEFGVLQTFDGMDPGARFGHCQMEEQFGLIVFLGLSGQRHQLIVLEQRGDTVTNS